MPCFRAEITKLTKSDPVQLIKHFLHFERGVRSFKRGVNSVFSKLSGCSNAENDTEAADPKRYTFAMVTIY